MYGSFFQEVDANEEEALTAASISLRIEWLVPPSFHFSSALIVVSTAGLIDSSYFIWHEMSIDVSIFFLVGKIVLERRFDEIGALHQAEGKVSSALCRQRKHLVEVDEMNSDLLRLAIMPVDDLHFDSGVLHDRIMYLSGNLHTLEKVAVALDWNEPGVLSLLESGESGS